MAHVLRPECRDRVALSLEAWKMCFINQGLCTSVPCNVLMSLRILSQVKYFKVIANTRVGRRFWSQ